MKNEAPMLGPFKALIDQWVAEDEKKPRKKRRTARRMVELLKQEHGYRGAESTLRWYGGQSRRQARHKVYVMLDYQPGEAAQMDFGEGEVIIAGETVTAQLFLMWLGHSSATFIKAYPAQKQEMFFDGHVSAFAFFGGVPHQVWYDNLKAAVYKVLQGHNRQEQAAFVSFRSHYLFEAHYCNTQSGWEKGGVEGRVGYGRRNWLVPTREFASWDVLNDYLAQQCRQEWERRLRGRVETIGQRLAREQAHFRLLPTPFACARMVAVKPNHYRRLATEAATSGQAYEEYLLTLLEQEVGQRDVNRRKRRVQDARFPRLHTLDEYDFSLMPDLPQQKILQLARCDFLPQAENVLFIGGIGTGKTHLAISIGLAAC